MVHRCLDEARPTINEPLYLALRERFPDLYLEERRLAKVACPFCPKGTLFIDIEILTARCFGCGYGGVKVSKWLKDLGIKIEAKTLTEAYVRAYASPDFSILVPSLEAQNGLGIVPVKDSPRGWAELRKKGCGTAYSDATEAVYFGVDPTKPAYDAFVFVTEPDGYCTVSLTGTTVFELVSSWCIPIGFPDPSNGICILTADPFQSIHARHLGFFSVALIDHPMQNLNPWPYFDKKRVTDLYATKSAYDHLSRCKLLDRGQRVRVLQIECSFMDLTRYELITAIHGAKNREGDRYHSEE